MYATRRAYSSNVSMVTPSSFFGNSMCDCKIPCRQWSMASWILEALRRKESISFSSPECVVVVVVVGSVDRAREDARFAATIVMH